MNFPSEQDAINKVSKIPIKTIIVGIVLLITGIAIFELVSGIYDVVPKGRYQVKQTWFFGDVDAKMDPGFWFTFGPTQSWPVAETFYFTADAHEGKKDDQSIEVQFNDGSLARISGTCRIVMPRSKDDAVALVTKKGFKSFEDVELKLALPTLRNALRRTANLMSARESYSEKQADFVNWARDQTANGLYETEEIFKTTKDPISGQEITKSFKQIKKDKNGTPQHQFNPLQGTGIVLDNFEVKEFRYDKTVREQIATQQQAYMAVETARANAAKAAQDKETIEAQGKAAVAAADYKEQEVKVRAVVQAKRDKETAEIQAQKEREVAKFLKEAAEQEKLATILRAEGESKARELKLKADDYQQMKIDAWKEVQFKWADAFAKRQVPSIIMGQTAGDQDSATLGTKSLLDVYLLKGLGIDMNIGVPAPRK
jgi:regulator of protease activity HflC (stomatin/prohibitin superfamily)